MGSAQVRAVEMYAEGHPLSQIAAATGLSKQRVCNLARASGFSRHASRPLMTVAAGH